MREHPIPQDITGYRFHIIGNMTLRQFGELALGVILAVAVYATNLPLVLKLPFIVIFIIAGVVAAFIPIAERPLDHWLMTFFRVLYRPTLYFWQKSPPIPQAFTYTSTQTIVLEPELDFSPARRQRIKEYISSVSYALPSVTDFEPEETQRMNSILQNFDSITVTQTTAVATAEKPTLDVRVRNMRISEDILDNLPINAISAQVLDAQPEVAITFENQHLAQPADTNKQILDSNQVAQKIEIPDMQTMKLESTILETSTDQPQQAVITTGDRVYSQYQNSVTSPTASLTDTAYNTSLPFPNMPTEPNKPVGMVLSPTNELITGAIIEIKTSAGAVARAVKTNALGQFFVTTPLEPGEYIIETEKTGYTFTSQTLHLENSIVPPIEIRGVPVI